MVVAELECAVLALSLTIIAQTYLVRHYARNIAHFHAHVGTRQLGAIQRVAHQDGTIVRVGRAFRFCGISRELQSLRYQ